MAFSFMRDLPVLSKAGGSKHEIDLGNSPSKRTTIRWRGMESMKELLLEIGTEEIPAGFVQQALVDLEILTRKELEAQRIDFGEVKTLGTPRTLVLVIPALSARQ